MKITDLFTRIPKGSADTDGGKVSRLIQPVQPVGLAGKLNLVPGQLLQGEVVGEDSNGLLLLKLAGEIISARTPIKLEPGQQFWFEVKEAGDSPLLNLASGKGAIQDLLKEIMATRPLLVKTQSSVDASPASPSGPQSSRAPQPSPSPAAQALTEAASPSATSFPEFQEQDQSKASAQAPTSQAVQTSDRGLPLLARDGTLPPESVRLVRALVSLVNSGKGDIFSQQETVGAQKFPPLIKTITTLIRDEQIPPSLQKLEGFGHVVRPGVRPGLEAGQPRQDSRPGVAEAGSKDVQSPPTPEGGRSSLASSAAFSSAEAALAPGTIKILNALVAISGIRPPTAENQGPLQPVGNPDQNLAEILSVIGREGKIPKALQQLAPLRMLMNPAANMNEGLLAGAKQPYAGQESQPVGGGGGLSSAAFPLQYAAAQQGAEPLPGQLRLLASLMGLGPKASSSAAWHEIEEILVRIPEGEMPAATRKFASFFEAHSKLNEELAAPTGGQSDFYIMPSVFAGQAGWGEWLWSKEGPPAGNDRKSQENLVFFLEMSNLGALTIQILLREKKLRGQIIMSDQKGSELVASLLPGLQPRLEALGYDMVDFSCTCQPVNLMQELKENLHGQIGSGAVSLLDVQV
ncbi:MAG: flagellar hook-length control protein FliK [Thermodesulfobacteriota bacterium]